MPSLQIGTAAGMGLYKGNCTVAGAAARCSRNCCTISWTAPTSGLAAMGMVGNFLMFLLTLGFAVGQDSTEAPTAEIPLVKLEPLTSRQLRELRLVHDPRLLEVAARVNSRVLVEFTQPMMTVVVQEMVNVNMDCYPWASNFPGGSIRWLSRSLTLGTEGLEVGTAGTFTIDNLKLWK